MVVTTSDMISDLVNAQGELLTAEMEVTFEDSGRVESSILDSGEN